MSTVHTERRRDPRHRMSTYALSANQDILAEVLDISNSGISCRCLTCDDAPLPAVTELGLLDCTFGKSVENLACRVVRSSRETSQRKTFVNFSLKFENVTSNQRHQLEQFIKST